MNVRVTLTIKEVHLLRHLLHGEQDDAMFEKDQERVNLANAAMEKLDKAARRNQ